MSRHVRAVTVAVLTALIATIIASAARGQEELATCTPPLPLANGQVVFTRPGVFIRSLPSVSGRRVDYHAGSVTLKIVAGPVCADGYNWWQIEGPGNDGWVAEGAADFRLLFPDDTVVETGDCGAPLLSLSEGEALRMRVAARVRAAPGFHQRVLALLARNTPMAVRGAPACVNGVQWWPVWAPANGQFVEAWVAEQDDDGTVLVEPAGPRTGPEGEPCAPPYHRLHVGLEAVVSYNDHQPKNLRAAPGREAPVLTQLLDGIAVEITDGPVCDDGLNWWQVRVIGSPQTTGWMAEGGTGAGGYWLFPMALIVR